MKMSLISVNVNGVWYGPTLGRDAQGKSKACIALIGKMHKQLFVCLFL